MAKQRRVLVVAAHPDDEMLGCAGTVFTHAQAGDSVSILLLGQGEGARGTASAMLRKAQKELLVAARTAAGVVGAELVGIRELPDNEFDRVTLLSIVRLIEEVIAAIKPTIIYTHHSGDLNVDHQLTCRAVVTASRAQGGSSPDILSFEVRSATDYAEALPSLAPFRPTVWQPLNEGAVTAKLRSLEAYAREMRDWPHSRSIRAIRAQLEHRGAQVGVEAAEAFMLLREIRRPGES